MGGKQQIAVNVRSRLWKLSISSTEEEAGGMAFAKIIDVAIISSSH